MHKLLTSLTLCAALLCGPLASSVKATPIADPLTTAQTYSGLFHWLASASVDPVAQAYFANAAVAMDTSYAILASGDTNPATFASLAQQAYSQAAIWHGYPEAVAAFTGLGDGYTEVASWLTH